MALLTLNKGGQLCLKGAGGIEKAIARPKPQNVLLLIDTSGSMAGSKINQAQEGAVDFARAATPKGYATALAVFGNRAAMVCDPSLDNSEFESKISGLRVGVVGSTTDLAAGLRLAAKFSTLNAVVIITDGQPNSKKAALEEAQSLKERGIDILCIGTDDADADFLAQLASRSDLSLHVDAENLRTSIGSASRLLLGSGR